MMEMSQDEVNAMLKWMKRERVIMCREQRKNRFFYLAADFPPAGAL